MGNANMLTVRTQSNCLVAVAINEGAGIPFKAGDKIMASGFLAAPAGQEVLVANRIDYGNQRFLLACANGANGGTCSWVPTGAPTPVTLTALDASCQANGIACQAAAVGQ